jgi:fluoroquinolone transport system permease protein
MIRSNLMRLVGWDIQLQARENVYAFTVLTTAAFAVVVSLLPADVPPSVVIAILYLDPAVVGTSFVGAMVLMERSQNTLPALAVTPLSPVDYVVSKIITLTGLTLAGAMALVAVAWWPLSLDLVARMVLALAFSGTLGVLTGLALIATANSMNHFIARAFPLSLVLFLPFFAHFGMVDGWLAWLLFGINPGHAVLRSLLWAADPGAVDIVEVVYAFGYMAVLIAVLLPWTIHLHTATIGRAA